MTDVKRQTYIWGGLAIVFVLALWGLGDVVLPFILGIIIAYLLDPVASRLERLGLSRVAATVLISVSVILAITVFALLIIPTLARQTSDLIQAAPDLMANLIRYLNTTFPEAFQSGSVINNSLQSMAVGIQQRAGQVVEAALTSLGSVINVVMILVVAPVVAFYLLLDWSAMIERINSLLPRAHAPTIRRLAHEIDVVVAAFIRGMFSICMIMGLYYAIALMLVGLNFGLAIGFFAGLVTFIPYVGAILGGVVAIGVALVQFWGDWWSVGAVAGVFVLGQALEGNVITPKIVGNSVGLHPVWLIFALSVFGALFGFVGMLVAVPVAAAIGVLIRHFLMLYQQSELYTGGVEPVPLTSSDPTLPPRP